MKAVVLCLMAILAACAEPPQVGVTISNTPGSIESCGARTGACK